MQQSTKLFFLGSLLYMAAPVLAQPVGIAALDTVIDHAVHYGCFNGEVLVVDDDMHYDRVVGFRDNAAKEPLVTGALFNIASVSKPFTARYCGCPNASTNHGEHGFPGRARHASPAVER